jgi:hypothetical protein
MPETYPILHNLKEGMDRFSKKIITWLPKNSYTYKYNSRSLIGKVQNLKS